MHNGKLLVPFLPESVSTRRWYVRVSATLTISPNRETLIHRFFREVWHEERSAIICRERRRGSLASEIPDDYVSDPVIAAIDASPSLSFGDESASPDAFTFLSVSDVSSVGIIADHQTSHRVAERVRVRSLPRRARKIHGRKTIVVAYLYCRIQSRSYGVPTGSS